MTERTTLENHKATMKSLPESDLLLEGLSSQVGDHLKLHLAATPRMSIKMNAVGIPGLEALKRHTLPTEIRPVQLEQALLAVELL